jgi:hypothetical protein
MHHAAPTAAVIIPTYNRMNLVGQAVASILNQTRPPDEVVVVDDGSTDGTADVVTAFGRRVRYIKKKNAGKAAALNQAMTEVRSDYIWLMDDDDVALPNALETHLEFLATRTDIDFSYGAHYQFNSDGPPKMEWLPWQDPMPIAAAAPEELFVRAMFWFPFYLQGMLVPRRCYEKAGPFAESLTFTEDYDMILRLTRRFRGGNVNAPIFCLRVHAGLRGPAHERRSASERDTTFRDYTRGIFTRLYVALPLAEYLPRGAVAGAPSILETRQARLQRACIMSRHGLFEEAFEDLRIVLNESQDGATLSQRERQILTQMLNVEAWWLRAYPDYTAFLGRLLRRRRAHEALEACATGLGWQLETNARRGQYGEAMRFGAHLQQLVGAARLPAFITKALLRRYRQHRDDRRGEATS